MSKKVNVYRKELILFKKELLLYIKDKNISYESPVEDLSVEELVELIERNQDEKYLN